MLVSAGVVLVMPGSVALGAAVNGDIDTLRWPFASSALALLLAGILAMLRLREQLVSGIVAGLLAASFALSLAEMSAREITDATRYDSLWFPSCLAIVLGAIRLVDGAFRRGDPE